MSDEHELPQWARTPTPIVSPTPDVAAAEARGRQQGQQWAIDALRDRERYDEWVERDMNRWRKDPNHEATSFWPDSHHASQFARYLDSIAKEGRRDGE